MVVTTSSIFDFMSQHTSCLIDRREISSYDFSMLRHNLRIIIKNLHEGDASAMEISNALRTSLSEWLTVPVPFNEDTVEALSILGEPDAVAGRWGRDIKAAYDSSINAATKLSQSENPIRCEIRYVINELRDNGKRFKIFCHRSARPYFESIMLIPHHGSTDAGLFIHTAKDYRESTPFDVLIKVGPLRSRGWGGSPDALLTAPRFETLVHFVWSGCGDEQGFGLDPVTGSAIIGGSDSNSCGGISWVSSTKKTGDSQNESGLPFDEDEFQVFQSIAKACGKRSAILAQIDKEHGILFPARAQVLSFDPLTNENEQVGRRLPGETLTEEMFLIFPLLDDVNLGGLHARDGKLSPIWKKQLIIEFTNDQDGFCENLFECGIELLSLQSRVKDWCKPLTTVIPAPKKAEHFKILIDNLSIKEKQNDANPKDLWWQYAWREIRLSRGEAISEGRFGQEILEEEVDAMLNVLRVDIKNKCAHENDFIIEIPPSEELQGRFRFCKVDLIEDGFRAPDVALKSIQAIREFEQWRV
jgi:hypothetical protein